jgi:hypothetical protein
MNQFCSACGTALEEGARFCAKCGKPAGGGKAAAGQAAQPAGFSWPTGERLKVFLFALFLGLFGVHCFYTRRRIRGIIELLLGLGGPALMLGHTFSLRYRDLSASELYDGVTFNFLSPVYVPIWLGALANIVFLVLWIVDVFKIFKSTFNKVDPDLTKKHLLFLGVLLGLSIVGFIPGLGRLTGFLSMPALYLSGVFFGPLVGTIIAGVFYITNTVVFSLFPGYSVSISSVLFYALSTCITTAVTALIVYRCLKLRSPEGKPALKLPNLGGKPVLQGVLIGIACFVAGGIVLLLQLFVNRFTSLQLWGLPFSRVLLYAAIAGIIGAALPPLLAKKGLYLGPFVTPGPAAKEQTSPGTEGAA